jgi:threonine/homoserine/homoserine lactone efflux protein
MSTPSLHLFLGGLAILLVGILLPGWDTAATAKRAMKRRIYWVATIIAIAVLFVAGLPDLRSSLAFVAMACVLMGGWAYFRTPNIKIGGRIRSADPYHREPD